MTRLLAVLLLFGCADRSVQTGLPPYGEAKTILYGLQDDNGPRIWAQDVTEAQSLQASFVDDGEELILEARVFAETLDALNLRAGPIEETPEGRLPGRGLGSFTMTVQSDGTLSDWTEASTPLLESVRLPFLPCTEFVVTPLGGAIDQVSMGIAFAEVLQDRIYFSDATGQMFTVDDDRVRALPAQPRPYVSLLELGSEHLMTFGNSVYTGSLTPDGFMDDRLVASAPAGAELTKMAWSNGLLLVGSISGQVYQRSGDRLEAVGAANGAIIDLQPIENGRAAYLTGAREVGWVDASGVDPVTFDAGLAPQTIYVDADYRLLVTTTDGDVLVVGEDGSTTSLLGMPVGFTVLGVLEYRGGFLIDVASGFMRELQDRICPEFQAHGLVFGSFLLPVDDSVYLLGIEEDRSAVGIRLDPLP